MKFYYLSKNNSNTILYNWNQFQEVPDISKINLWRFFFFFFQLNWHNEVTLISVKPSEFSIEWTLYHHWIIFTYGVSCFSLFLVINLLLIFVDSTFYSFLGSFLRLLCWCWKQLVNITVKMTGVNWESSIKTLMIWICQDIVSLQHIWWHFCMTVSESLWMKKGIVTLLLWILLNGFIHSLLQLTFFIGLFYNLHCLAKRVRRHDRNSLLCADTLFFFSSCNIL